MVKVYVIHILQKKENGGGKTRQEEEEEEEITGAKEKMQIQSRRCKRESSAVGGLGGSQRPPRRRGGTRQQHEKEAQQRVQPHRSTRGFSSPHCADGRGRHGHGTFIPATISGPSLHQRQRGSPTPLPTPISTFARAKETGPYTWGYFRITIFKSALLLQKNLKHKRKLKLVTLPPRNDPIDSGHDSTSRQGKQSSPSHSALLGAWRHGAGGR